MDENIKALARDLLGHGIGRLSERERRVLVRIGSRRHVARDPRTEYGSPMTLGQRAPTRSPAGAAPGASWAALRPRPPPVRLEAPVRPFDPYPFVVLNLLPSMLAAARAPIIMMSQNRQAEIDRHQAGSDLEAEPEITEPHARLDRPAEILRARSP